MDIATSKSPFSAVAFASAIASIDLNRLCYLSTFINVISSPDALFSVVNSSLPIRRDSKSVWCFIWLKYILLINYDKDCISVRTFSFRCIFFKLWIVVTEVKQNWMSHENFWRKILAGLNLMCILSLFILKHWDIRNFIFWAHFYWSTEISKILFSLWVERPKVFYFQHTAYPIKDTHFVGIGLHVGQGVAETIIVRFN